MIPFALIGGQPIDPGTPWGDRAWDSSWGTQPVWWLDSAGLNFNTNKGTLGGSIIDGQSPSRMSYTSAINRGDNTLLYRRFLNGASFGYGSFGAPCWNSGSTTNNYTILIVTKPTAGNGTSYSNNIGSLAQRLSFSVLSGSPNYRVERQIIIDIGNTGIWLQTQYTANRAGTPVGWTRAAREATFTSNQYVILSFNVSNISSPTITSTLHRTDQTSVSLSSVSTSSAVGTRTPSCIPTNSIFGQWDFEYFSGSDEQNIVAEILVYPSTVSTTSIVNYLKSKWNVGNG